jgi:predicted DNA-binding protein
MVKQSSIQLTDETRRQIEELAERWGLGGQRNTTEVITRSIERIWMLEIGYERYRDQEKKSQ